MRRGLYILIWDVSEAMNYDGVGARQARRHVSDTAQVPSWCQSVGCTSGPYNKGEKERQRNGKK